MEISKFYEKFNKIDGNIYVVEERVGLTGGVYDAPLQHDNINTSTLSVYTGPKLTGERIQTYVLSTPSLTPWKRTIRVYADVPTVYISYEAEGDTVEAEDVNQLQEEVVRTQEAINEEVSRAEEAEQYIAADLREEVARAKAAEQMATENLTAEINRSKGAEQELSWSLTAEINRAKAAEKESADNLVTETTRAKAAESVLMESLSTEETRALAAEALLESKKANASDVNSELSNRYTKDQTYSRQEILDKIESLIGAAPETLDTFQEVAKALGEDPNFATTIMTILSGKVDKEDGKGLSANDYSDTEQDMLVDVNNKKHTHSNRSTIDKITETLLSRWNEAFDKRHEHGNKGILDSITQVLLDNWNAAFTHISDAVKHITAAERANWNDADSKKHSHSNKTILDGITHALIDHWNAAEMNVQADWNVTDTASDAYVKNKPTSLPASDVSAWAKASTKPGYAWSEISGKPTSFSPAAHTHTKSQITDMSTKVSEFENDTGYITAADIDTSQNHTHANKSVLDTITQTFLNNWNAAYTHISNKSNPHGVTAAQVGALESLQLSNSDNLDEIKIPGFYFAGGGNAVIGKPSGIDAFGLQVYKTASGYVTQDLIAGTGNPYKRYTRQWSNSAWNDWIPLPTFTSAPVSGQVVISDGVTGGIKSSGFTIAKSVPSNAAFTDTVYTHPNSGVIAGTYRSVTVNTQGHVTSGSNPTTLADYGITDAAAKTHNHDITYLKRTGLTWDDLKGV